MMYRERMKVMAKRTGSFEVGWSRTMMQVSFKSEAKIVIR